MAVHIAILKPCYAAAVLAGTKTIESRLTKTAMPPYRTVEAGQRIYLKASGGPFVGMARAARVQCFEPRGAGGVDALRARFEPAVGGDDAYWHAKRDSRYATFVTLAAVEPIDVGPAYTKSMRAWHVVDDDADPVREVTLTGGAVRNGYVSLSDPVMAAEAATPRKGSPASAGVGLTLELPDERIVHTDYARGHMLRWRGWPPYFRAHGLGAGDRVRFVRTATRRYRVSFPTAAGRPAS